MNGHIFVTEKVCQNKKLAWFLNASNGNNANARTYTVKEKFFVPPKMVALTDALNKNQLYGKGI